MGIEGRLVEAQQPVGHGCLVLEVARQRCTPILVAPPHACALTHLREQESRIRLRGLKQVPSIQHSSGVGKGAQHQSVPSGDHLLVAVRPRPSCPRRQQPFARRVENLDRARRHRVQDVAALEISRGRHIERAAERARLFDTEDRLQLLRYPQIEAALLAFGIRVEARVEAAFGRCHLPQDERQRRFGHASERQVMGQLPGIEVGARQQRVVVEHLFEMRYEPTLVDAVPVEPAAQLVIHAAGRHRAQCLQCHLQCGWLAGSDVVTQQHLDEHRLRKFRGAPEAGMDRVEVARELCGGLVKQSRGERAHSERHRWAVQKIAHLGCRLSDVGRPFGKSVGDRGQHAFERRHPKTIARRKVGACKKWSAVRQQKNRHRPSAGAGHALDRAHVNLIEVRPLFAVDLDRDEVAVHQRGGIGIFERLTGHDVAPVAGTVADAQQNRLVFGPRARQRLGAPWKPVDRVVGMFLEVGTGLLRKSIAHRITLAALRRMAAVMGQMDYGVEMDGP